MKNLNVLALVLMVAVLAVAIGGCGADEFEFRQEMIVKGTLNIDQAFEGQDGATATEDLLETVVFAVDFPLSEKSPELTDYNGLFKEMRIEQLTYTVTENSMTTDLEEVQLAFGPLGMAALDDPDAVLVASLPPIPAGFTGEGTGQTFPQNAAAASKHVFDLDFGMVSGSEISVRKDEPLPEGKLKIDIAVTVTLIADAL